MAEGTEGLGGRVQRVEQQLEALNSKVEQLTESVERRFEGVDRRFEAVDRRFDEVDRRFDEVDRRFDDVDRRFQEMAAAIAEQREYTDLAFTTLNGKMDAGFSRLERKLDQFIDVQLQTNQLVDRRLQALENRQ